MSESPECLKIKSEKEKFPFCLKTFHEVKWGSGGKRPCNLNLGRSASLRSELRFGPFTSGLILIGRRVCRRRHAQRWFASILLFLA